MNLNTANSKTENYDLILKTKITEQIASNWIVFKSKIL